MLINYVLDCADPDALAGFWAAALGFERGAWRPPSPYVSLTRPGAGPPEMLLQQVPEPKQAKNRMHLDLRVADSEAEVARLAALGATVVRGPFDDEGHWTTVMADPEGNEFCVIVSPEEWLSPGGRPPVPPAALRAPLRCGPYYRPLAGPEARTR